MRTPHETHDLPVLVAADTSGAGDVPAWAKSQARAIEESVSHTGAVLIRGLGIDSPAAFRAVAAAIRPDLKSYAGGDSPRTDVADRVYTASEYPAHLEVRLHNELSYAVWSPERVFFACLKPAETGGATHIADGRAVLAALEAQDPELPARFADHGVAYLQHLWDADGPPGVGKSWQETFETDDRNAVAEKLGADGIDFAWTDFGLRTRAVRPAVVRHGATGDACWFCQADQWHRAAAGVKVEIGGRGGPESGDGGGGGDPRYDPATAGEASLGNHATFGDGGEIDPADLAAIRAATDACEVVFPWQAGDVMVLDNTLVMHGRKPFTGRREVLVAMA